ncbi:MAG: hypothetical protein MUC63_08910, partial [Planctomycetes bacterium]|nr:hypothetical protein [Planctomycetota bacterium]
MKTTFRILRILLGLAVLVGFASPTVRAQGPGKDEKDLKLLAGDKDKALQLQVNNAVQKGADWLKSVQNPNGTWTCCWAKYAAPHNYPMGETALALLALLKSGENPESECIKKGFAWLRTQPLQKTYEVGTLLMALEALYAPKSPPPIDPKEITQVVKQAVKVPPADLDWMRQCTEFLLRVMIASQRMKGEDTG